jgi:hypothetical protein
MTEVRTYADGETAGLKSAFSSFATAVGTQEAERMHLVRTTETQHHYDFLLDVFFIWQIERLDIAVLTRLKKASESITKAKVCRMEQCRRGLTLSLTPHRKSSRLVTMRCNGTQASRKRCTSSARPIPTTQTNWYIQIAGIPFFPTQI